MKKRYGNYIANTWSRIVHKSNCDTIKNTRSTHVEYFKTRKEAIVKDYRPCRVCSPFQQGLVGNKWSKKVHTLDCWYLPPEHNRHYFETFAEAEGFTPCDHCMGD